MIYISQKLTHSITVFDRQVFLHGLELGFIVNYGLVFAVIK